jgi:glycosyltransferase involved in cell wall biosynthesis
MKKHTLVIDAVNIRNGGGVTHLIELLNNCEPYLGNIEKIVVWSKRSTLDLIPDHIWLEKKHHSFLEKNIFFRIFWQKFFLKNEMILSNSKLLFLPGSGFINSGIDFVTMCRNVLPFDLDELKKYKYSLSYIKFNILRYIHITTFNKSQGLIFLNQFAEDFVGKHLRKDHNSKIIAHGCNEIFFKSIEAKKNNSFKTYIYVSRLEPYKNHINLLKAIDAIKLSGFKLLLIGPLGHNSDSIFKLIKSSSYLTENTDYLGDVNQTKLASYYSEADIGIFLSSCENLPNILIEKMASGLPMICTNKRPMTDILSSNNFFVDEHDVESIKKQLEAIHAASNLNQLSSKNISFAQTYSWEICANKTFSYLNATLKKLYG